MQPGSIVPTTSAAPAAKNAPITDSAKWQSALAQADGQPVASAIGKTEGKPVTKPGKKNAPGEQADIETQKAFAATEKTLLQRSKKPQVPVVGSNAPPTTKHNKDIATPVVSTAAQPVAVASDTSPVSVTPRDAKPTAHVSAVASGTQQQSGPPVSKDITNSTTLPSKSVTDTSAHDIAPAVLAQSAVSAAVVPSLATVVTPPIANPTTAVQTASTSHDAKVEKTGAAEITIDTPSVKTSAVSNTEIIAAPPVAIGKDDDSSNQQPTAIQPVTLSAPAVHEAAPQPIQVTALTTTPVTQPSAAGLAAAVTAMHQSGQSAAVLRLDPPGLGNLSVHVSLAQSGQVNVLFIPSTQVAATTLQNNLPGLGTALAQSGISLGQAQVGGQFNQNAGQGAYQPPSAPAFAQTPASYESETPNGVSAYA